MAELSAIMAKIATQKKLSAQELQDLDRIMTETQQRNSQVANYISADNKLTLDFPLLPIYSEVLTVDTASLTITIPGGYRHILFIGSGRCTAASYGELLNVQFNGDTGSNYVYAFISANGAGAAIAHNGSDSATAVRFGSFSAASAPAGTVSSFWSFIQDYTSSTFHKNFNSLSNRETDVLGHNNIELHTGAWKSNAVIESVKITPASGSLAAGSALTVFLLR